MTPLDQFKARWNAVAMPLPLVDIVNKEVNLKTKVDPWAGAILQSEQRTDVTMGSSPWVEENGDIGLVLFAKSGGGENLLDDAVAAVRANFHGWVSADHSIQFPAVVGPENAEPEANGEWWVLSMRIPYVAQSRR